MWYFLEHDCFDKSISERAFVSSNVYVALKMPPQMPIASIITSVQFSYKSKAPEIPSSGLINLLEHLTELRETLTYPYQFIKEY